jgi:hypothetical protein
MKQNLEIAAGEVINLSEGEYSDYGYAGNVVFRHSCNLETLAFEWMRSIYDEAVNTDWYNGLGIAPFIAWLIVEGHAVPFECREIHVGSYGCVEVGAARTTRDPTDWNIPPPEGV